MSPIPQLWCDQVPAVPKTARANGPLILHIYTIHHIMYMHYMYITYCMYMCSEADLPLAVGLELGAHQNSDRPFQPSCRPRHLHGLGFGVESLGPGLVFQFLFSFLFSFTISSFYFIFIIIFPLIYSQFFIAHYSSIGAL